MVSRRTFAGALLGGVAVGAVPAWAEERKPERPNFLVIVADDLGFSDIGPFGGEIETPNLDRLARSGVRLSGYHTAPTCSPTRAMLMSGVDHHRAGLGSMAEMLTESQKGRPGYEGYLNDRVAPLPDILKAGGYRTLMSGKWHLGHEESQSPAARGFERSFALLGGAHNHFGADPEAPEGTPFAIRYREDRKLTRYPEGAYSSDYFADRLVGFLKEGERDRRPIFAYLAFTAPHWPLQAPPESIAKYRGKYDEGPEALRRKRLERLKAEGLAGDAAAPLVETSAWSGLTVEERRIAARKMEIYAGMVDRMDQNIGKVLAEFERQGRLQNTVVIFTSDNGAEGSPMDGPMRAGSGGGRPIEYDNRFEELGTARSYFAYGMGWAQAATAPLRQVKGTTYEGGLRTPAIVSGPGVARAGRVADATVHVKDIAPTVLDLAGVAAPRTWKGREVAPIEGKSWRPLLSGAADRVRTDDEPLGWELFHRRAIRRGDWKAVYTPPSADGQRYSRVDPVKSGEWELYNLKLDPSETRNLAEREPQKLKEMVEAWNRYAAGAGVVVPAALNP